jgi:hypothetical protein
MSEKQASHRSPVISYEKGQEPPQAPDIPRQWKFHSYQYIAIPLLILIPVLALLGILGETSTTVEVANEGLVLRVHYPDRAHYEAYNHIEVTVRNDSSGVLSGAAVEFDRELLTHFSQLSVNPSLSEITETAYRVELGDIEAGGERVVTLDYQPDMNGAHDSWVRLTVDGIAPVQAGISMFVFP